VLDVLADDDEPALALHGTLGPPDFDVETGTREAQASVYCVGPHDEYPELMVYKYDVLRYRAESDTLEGEFSCFDGF
jgi:hypothetical protein